MESVRSKKVRSRRTPVANLASFAPRERLSANRDRRGAAASRTPPISAVRVRLTQPHLFRTAAPGHRVALPAPVGRPPRLPAPRKAYRRAPLRARQRPVVRARQRPHVSTPLFASILPTSEEASSAPLPPTTSQPVAQRYVSKAALSSRAFANHPLPSH